MDGDDIKSLIKLAHKRKEKTGAKLEDSLYVLANSAIPIVNKLASDPELKKKDSKYREEEIMNKVMVELVKQHGISVEWYRDGIRKILKESGKL